MATAGTELTGKRLLCLFGDSAAGGARAGTGPSHQQPPSLRDRDWHAGLIRAVISGPSLTVYVDFDDSRWKKHAWVKVYAEDVLVFLVEHTLVWAPRKEPAQQGGRLNANQWPALTYKALVDKIGLGSIIPVEFFGDRVKNFATDGAELRLFKEDSDSQNPIVQDNQKLQEAMTSWIKEKKIQEIIRGPCSLQGHRVKIYQPDSSEEWILAVVAHHDPSTRTMVVTTEQEQLRKTIDPMRIYITLLDETLQLLKGETDIPSQSFGTSEINPSMVAQKQASQNYRNRRKRGTEGSPPYSPTKEVDERDKNKDSRRRKNLADGENEPAQKKVKDKEEIESDSSSVCSHGPGGNGHNLPKTDNPDVEQGNFDSKKIGDLSWGNADSASDRSRFVPQPQAGLRYATYTKENGRTLVVQDEPIHGKPFVPIAAASTAVPRLTGVPFSNAESLNPQSKKGLLTSDSGRISEVPIMEPSHFSKDTTNAERKTIMGTGMPEQGIKENYGVNSLSQQRLQNVTPESKNESPTSALVNPSNFSAPQDRLQATFQGVKSLQASNSATIGSENSLGNSSPLESSIRQQAVTCNTTKGESMKKWFGDSTQTRKESVSTEDNAVQLSDKNQILMDESKRNGNEGTNGTLVQESRAFGFGFGRNVADTPCSKVDNKISTDLGSLSNNLFFQCMPQNVPQSNYFTAISESLSNDPLSFNSFKVASNATGQKSAMGQAVGTPTVGLNPGGKLGQDSEKKKPLGASEVMPTLTPAFPRGTSSLHFLQSVQPPDLLKEEMPTIPPANPFLGFADLKGNGDVLTNRSQSNLFRSDLTRPMASTPASVIVKPPLLTNWKKTDTVTSDVGGNKTEIPKIFSSQFSSSTQKASYLSTARPDSPETQFGATNVEMPTLSTSPTGDQVPGLSVPISSSMTSDNQHLRVFSDTSHSGKQQQAPFAFSSSNNGVDGPSSQQSLFDQRRFSLDERSLGIKQESDSASDSDLSDLSDSEVHMRLQSKSGLKGFLSYMHERREPNGEGSKEQIGKARGRGRGRPRGRPPKISVDQSVLKDVCKVRKLKQSGESFLQDGSCINVAPHLHKCRECRLVRYRKFKDHDESTVSCRFFHFRKLAFTRTGVLRVGGFLNPRQCDTEALSLWIPSRTPAEGLDLETSKYILANVGDQFCQLVMSEKEAMLLVEPHQQMAWKRAVRGIREMCDACETTLFNIHWVCRKCGFGVCLDCYRMRKSRLPQVDDDILEDEVFSWLKCAKGQTHDPANLMPTQIIPSTALYDIGDMVHATRGKWGIKANCPCITKQLKPLSKPAPPNGVSQLSSSLQSPAATVISNEMSITGGGSLMRPQSDSNLAGVKPESADTSNCELGEGTDINLGDDNCNSVSFASDNEAYCATSTLKDTTLSSADTTSALHWLADLATQKAKEEKKESSNSLKSVLSQNQDSKPPLALDSFNALSKPPSILEPFSSLLSGGPSSSKTEGSSLRDLLNSAPGKLQRGATETNLPFPSAFTSVPTTDKGKGGLPNFLDHIIASVVENKMSTDTSKRSGNTTEAMKETKKQGVMEMSVLDPNTQHCWLCDGRLLCLQDPSNKNNWKIFRECWKQGQPVLVSGVHKKLNTALWKPEAFSQEFGDQEVDLVNCRNCAIISDVKVRDFWDGFEIIAKRLKSEEGHPMVLKLKDWPPGEDFRDMMPTRFDDLMNNLPLPEYTKRDGRLNLASRLPNYFVRPDLGPKMYNAYGLITTEDRKVGTTNLHLDVSDAVNVMVYVGIPIGENNHEEDTDNSGVADIQHGNRPFRPTSPCHPLDLQPFLNGGKKPELPEKTQADNTLFKVVFDSQKLQCSVHCLAQENFSIYSVGILS
ncbi:lysine-specific demethylase 3B-like isoform X2 [Narcine bancroftii]|uniref:lysine-specific demethylase 3B-like isoform X2 n=1 Tax=Narcine bancroftii TaxID=1343680 RepID=UPI00383185A2